MGQAGFIEVQSYFEKSVQAGHLIERQNEAPGRAFTTLK